MRLWVILKNINLISHSSNFGMRTFQNRNCRFSSSFDFWLFLAGKVFKSVLWQRFFSLRESFDKSVHFGTSRILEIVSVVSTPLSFFSLKYLISRSLLGDLGGCSNLHYVNHYDKCTMNNKSGVTGGVAAMLIITHQYRAVKQFCTCLRVYRKLSWSFCRNSRKLWYWPYSSLLEKKKNNVTFYNIIDWRLFFFLDYKTEGGNCKWRKENFAEIWLFFLSAVLRNWPISRRQIRYYEDQELIKPDRNEGNRRMYSLNDMDRLLEIKDYISEGHNIAGWLRRNTLNVRRSPRSGESDEVRRALHNEPPAGSLLQQYHLLVAV